jgi:glycosyltransferase involved in cell wall biosynthesis
MKEGCLKLKDSNKNPVLSIITVVYNGEKFLERTIESIISQTFFDYEYIIIDGGSTDKTLEIIKKYENKIDYWISERDNGIYDAMNKGIKIAKGKWLNFMNSSDVFYHNNTLKSIFSSTLNLDKIQLIYSDWYICDSLLAPNVLREKISSWEKGNILHQSIIYQKKLHDKYGLYIVSDNRLIADYFFFSLIPKSSVIKTNSPISVNDINGVSYGDWCMEQKTIVDLLFKRINIFSFLVKTFIIFIKKIIKLVLRIS